MTLNKNVQWLIIAFAPISIIFAVIFSYPIILTLYSILILYLIGKYENEFVLCPKKSKEKFISKVFLYIIIIFTIAIQIYMLS